MSKRRILALCVLCVGALTAAGCGMKPPETMAEAKEMAESARADAQAAREAGEVKDAEKAVKRATLASETAPSLVVSSEDNVTCAEIASAAKETILLAELTEEDVRLADEVSSWKAGLYRKGRGAAMKATCASLALAARQAKGRDFSSLPEEVQNAAEAAADVAREVSGRPALADGTPDWEGIAADMDALGNDPPARLGLILAVGFALSGSNRLALYEIERLDAAQLALPEERALHPYLRGFILSGAGFPRLSVEQMERAAKADGENPGEVGPELLATIHLVLAYEHATKREYREADLELVRAMKVWPDGPVSAFLTGQQLAADGRYEEAADSLEKQSRGTKLEWLSRSLSARAREVRDNKGEARPLFTDTVFLGELALFYMADAAGEDAANGLNRFMNAARSFTQTIRGFLPEM